MGQIPSKSLKPDSEFQAGRGGEQGVCGRASKPFSVNLR